MKVSKGLEDKQGIILDLGCGRDKLHPTFTGMDKENLPGVDIVHDIEVMPWPLEDESCLTVVSHHLIEHIKPWLTIDLFDELWRVMKLEGQVVLSTPYCRSEGYYADPTHCNPFSEKTFQYFDPRYYGFTIYHPKPWLIEKGFPVYQITGNIECIMRKITIEEGEKIFEENAERRSFIGSPEAPKGRRDQRKTRPDNKQEAAAKK